jgi:hypothetical protein
VLTDKTVAVNAALVDPDVTVTEAGTVAELLLLVRVTTIPVLDAGEFRVTVQESVPEPVIEAFVQKIALKTAGGIVADTDEVT